MKVAPKSHKYAGDDRCSCGSIEVYFDDTRGSGYGCEAAGLWADKLRRHFGERTGRVVTQYLTEVVQCYPRKTDAQRLKLAREWALDDLEEELAMTRQDGPLLDEDGAEW